MTDKSIQELAVSVGLPVEKLLDQVREAGLPQAKAEDTISIEQQDRLVSHLKKVHGQDNGSAGKSPTGAINRVWTDIEWKYLR